MSRRFSHCFHVLPRPRNLRPERVKQISYLSHQTQFVIKPFVCSHHSSIPNMKHFLLFVSLESKMLMLMGYLDQQSIRYHFVINTGCLRKNGTQKKSNNFHSFLLILLKFGECKHQSMPFLCPNSISILGKMQKLWYFEKKGNFFTKITKCVNMSSFEEISKHLSVVLSP